jgi:hypothetical protein
VTGIDRGALPRHWVHSHEEDTADTMVFRPAGYGFPPSRGRTGLELRPDGSYVETGIGETDRPGSSGGRWELKDDRLELEGGSGTGRVLEVVSADENRLVVRRG